MTIFDTFDEISHLVTRLGAKISIGFNFFSESRGTDSSGEDDSDEDDQNGNANEEVKLFPA